MTDRGYDFVQAQQLAFHDRPLIQLIYLAPNGLPLALCFMADEIGQTPVVLAEHFGLATAEWTDAENRRVIISDVDEKTMPQLVAATVRQWFS